MTDETYGLVAQEYERTYGEPLVAGSEWVGPIFDTVEVAVVSDPSVTPGRSAYAEALERTAAVIAVMTYGLERTVAFRADT